MIAMMILALLSVDGLLARQHSKAVELLAALGSNRTLTVRDFQEFYGPNNEAEIAAVSQTVCGLKCGENIDSTCFRTVQARLKDAAHSRSEYLTHQRDYLRKRGFLSGTQWFEWPGHRGADGLREVGLRTSAGTLQFVFGDDDATVEEIMTPDGRALSDVLLNCAHPHRAK